MNNNLHLAISDISHKSKPTSGAETTKTLVNKYITIEELVKYIESGCGFSNPFRGNRGKDNCEPTNLITIDIDKVDVDMETIKNSIKGIIYYPTFSDSEIKHSYRVIVKTDKFINTRYEYKRYSDTLISMLNNKGIEVDNCCNQMERLYFGTNHKCIVNDVEYNYSLSELEEMALFYKISDDTIKSTTTTKKAVKSKENSLKKNFMNDFMIGVSFNVLENKYISATEDIIERTKIDWQDNELCREVNDYIQINNRWNNKEIFRYNVGEGRKRIEYVRLNIKKLINPDISFEELLKNGVYDVNHYFVNLDNKITNDWLYSTAKTIIDTDVEDIKKSLKKYIKPSTIKMNMGEIKKQNKTWQSVRGEYTRTKNKEEILEIFDCKLKLKDNYDIYRESGYKLGYTSYRRLCKSMNLDYKGKHN